MFRRAFGCSFLLFSASLFAQSDPAAATVTATHVAGAVHMLTGAGGNIGVSAGDDGIIIIDDQYAPLAPKIEAALAGISTKPVRFILNTHWHGDHTGGNEHFGKRAPIIAHTNVRRRLMAGSETRKVPPAPAGALPVLTFDDRVTLHLNGEDVRVIHFPHGHTDGDVVIFFTKSKVVHMGDNFFSGRFPFVDIDSGGSVAGLIRNIRSVMKQLPDGVRIIPGHGPLSTADDLRSYVEMLEGTSALFTAAMKAGRTLEQVKKDRLLAKYETFAGGFVSSDRFLDTLHREATEKRKSKKK